MMYHLYFLAVVSMVSAKCQWTQTGRWAYNPIETDVTCTNISPNNIYQEISAIKNTTKDPLTRYTYIFKNSSIQNFPINVFVSKKVDSLYLNHSQIEIIQAGAFSGLSQLQEIYLQHNSIKIISRGCFNSLVSLKIINLSNNLIHSIEDDSFHGSSDLRQIFLNNNKIMAVPELLFESLKLLGTVDLSNNYIKRFDFIFTNFKIYKSLYLENNNVSTVQCENLRTSFLDVISLKNNALKEFDGSCFPSNLEEIILNNNTISQINNTSLLQSIKYLDLSYNNISRLKSNELNNLAKLESLKLQNNKIKELEIGVFKDLHSLTSLNLSSNGIKILDYGAFSGLINLKNLDLSNNHLGVLEEDVFHTLKHLNVLNVSNNNLEYVNLVKLASYSSSLILLDLHGNNITCQKLAPMVSYKLPIRIMNGTDYNVPNVNGISCSNTNYLAKSSINNDVKLNNNIFQEMRLFFNSDFKNTTFFKFFSEADAPIFNTSYINNYRKNSDFHYKTHGETDFEQLLLKQISKNNVIFIIFTIFVAIISVLLLVLVLMLSKFVFKRPVVYPREPELSLL